MKHPIRSLTLAAAITAALTLNTQAVLLPPPPNVNTVGIINHSYAAGVNYMIGPPLDASPSDLSTIFPSATTPVGTKVGKFVPSIGDFYWSTNTANGWSSNIVFDVGEGFCLLPGADFIKTWAGEVRQGYSTNPITTGGGLYNLTTPPLPLGGNLNTNIMKGYPIFGGGYDRVLPWSVAGQDWPVNFGIFYPRGSHSNTWYLNYMIRPGESMFVERGTNQTPFTTNWVSFFTVDGSTNYTAPSHLHDLWVSIGNAATVQYGDSAVSTMTVTLHNMPSALTNYTLLCSSTVDSNQAWYPVCSVPGSGDYAVDLIWTNSPNPSAAAWTNSNYGNTLATNVPYVNIGMPSMYFTVAPDGYYAGPRTTGGGTPLPLQIQVTGAANFQPAIDNATQTGLTPTQTLPNGDRVFEFDPTQIHALNLGWNAQDYDYWLNHDASWNSIPVSGTTPANSETDYRHSSQNVRAIFNLNNCVNMTNFYACGNPFISGASLNFSGLTLLRDIELYQAGVSSINLANCSSLWRLCVESCNISGTLDLSGCTSLQDLRGACNQYSDITFPGGAGGAANTNLVHICIRDNTKLSPYVVSTRIDNSFTGLQELLCWGDNQSGALNLASSNLTIVQVHNNHFVQINFTNCTKLRWLWAENNNLSPVAMEHILGELYTNTPPGETLQNVYLKGNGPTTSNGLWFYHQLRAKKPSCDFTLDIPAIDAGDGWTIVQSARSGAVARFDKPNTAGNLLVCWAKCTSGDMTIGDDANNTWTEVTANTPYPAIYPASVNSVSFDSGAGTGKLRMWYCKSCVATAGLGYDGRNVVRVNGTGAAVGAVEIAGADPLAPLDDVPFACTWSSGVSSGTSFSGAVFHWDSDTNNCLAITAAACKYGELTPGSGSPLNVDNGVFAEWEQFSVNYGNHEYSWHTVNTGHGSGEPYATMTITLHKPRPVVDMGGGWSIQQARTGFKVDGYYTSAIACYPHLNTAGNLLLCCTWGWSDNISVTDSQGNTWQQVTAQLVPTGFWGNTFPLNVVPTGTSGTYLTVWYAKNCLPGANVVTAFGADCVQILEVAGADTTAPLDTATSQYPADGVSGPAYNYGDAENDAAQLLQYCGIGLSDKIACWRSLYAVGGQGHGNSMGISFAASSRSPGLSAYGNWLGLINRPQETFIYSEAGMSNNDHGHCVTVPPNAIAPAMAADNVGYGASLSWCIMNIVLHPPR
jgi:hypothetical protein